MTDTAHATPNEFRVVLVQPENPELIPRVEGQTRDLGVTLQVAPSGWSSGTAEQAAAVALERGADFVVRIQRSAQGVLEVRVYAAGQRSLRARRLPSHARSDRLTTSAELEAAALVLRGELTALIEAEREAADARRNGNTPAGAPGSIGSPGSSGTPGSAGRPPAAAGGVTRASRSQQLPSSKSRAKPASPSQFAPARANDADADSNTAADEPEDEPAEPLEDYTTGRKTTWTLRGGLHASAPLESEVAVGALVGARTQLWFFEVGLALTTALPVELADQNVRIALFRNSLTAEALAVIPVGPRLRALVGVDLGAVLYARSTERVGNGYFASGSSNAWSATVGAQTELQWLLTRKFGVALGLGLAYVLQRTRFSYNVEVSSQPHEIAELRSFEPQATASLFGLFGE